MKTHTRRYLVRHTRDVSHTEYVKVYIFDTLLNENVWSFTKCRANTKGPRAALQATTAVANTMVYILNTPGIPEPLLGPFAVWQVANALWENKPVSGMYGGAVSAAPVLWDYCIEHGIIKPK